MVHIGEIYDDYEVIADVGRRNNQRYFKMKCRICGHEKECGSSNIRRQNNSHNWNNCRNDYYAGMIGSRVNDYVIDDIRLVNNQYIATIRCTICGNTKETPASSINYHAGTKHSANACGESFWNSVVGKSFGDLTVIEIGDKKPIHRTLICRCKKCGTVMERMAKSIFDGDGVEHGRECIKAIPDSPHKRAIIRRFNCMRERCENPNNTNYKHYGARGIQVKYDHVVDFYYDYIDEFIKHSSVYGIRNSTFDRIDVNGNYEKGNIRLATQNVQSANTVRRKFFIAEKNDDVVLCDSTGEFYRKYNVSASAIGNAVRKAGEANGRNKYRVCDGWKIKGVWPSLSKEQIDNIVVTEGVTTKLLITV